MFNKAGKALKSGVGKDTNLDLKNIYFIASKLEPFFVMESTVELVKNFSIHKINKSVTNITVILELNKELL